MTGRPQTCSHCADCNSLHNEIEKKGNQRNASAPRRRDISKSKFSDDVRIATKRKEAPFLRYFIRRAIKEPRSPSSESVLWGSGCSAAAPAAAWRSVLGSAAAPAWWGQPEEEREMKRLWKLVFLAHKVSRNECVTENAKTLSKAFIHCQLLFQQFIDLRINKALKQKSSC